MTRREQLADHYIKAAGVVAVYVQPAGHRPAVGVLTNVGYQCPAGMSLLCCGRERDAILIAEVAHHRLDAGQGADVAAGLVLAAAAEYGIALTPHAAVVERARAAVARVEGVIDGMRAKGGLRALNRQFKAARQAGERAVYADQLHQHKAAMLTAMARGAKV